MGSYLQTYGAGEERRNKVIRNLILAGICLLVLLFGLYLFLHDFFEKRTVERFLADVNARNYQQAYAKWGCTTAAPCRNYDYNRFLEDWGPNKKIGSPWKVASVDGCKSFVTVNVAATGVEPEALGVERGTRTLMFAPAAECQEPQWRWKQFFQRMFGSAPPPPSPK